MADTAAQPAIPQIPISPADRPGTGDRIFRGLSVVAASLALVVVVSTVVILVRESRPALRSGGIVDFFTDSIWNSGTGDFGVLGVLVGTVIIATVALAVAVPLAVALAIFINEYAPRSIGRALTTAIDLLAALPSLIFGMWGRDAFAVHLQPVARWLSDHLFAIPVFRLSSKDVVLGNSSFVAGVIVGIMVIPIIASISRDVMARAPREQCEAALGLGSTRWGMIRAVILPFGRTGIIGAVLLAFGRALGETIAVLLVIQLSFEANWHILEINAGSIAAAIALKFPEASALERSGLAAAGLALVTLTFAVSLTSRRIVTRKALQ